MELRVARISAPEYYEPDSTLAKELFGIDLVISPEREVAWETLQLLVSEAATEFVHFMDDRVRLPRGADSGRGSGGSEVDGAA